MSRGYTSEVCLVDHRREHCLGLGTLFCYWPLDWQPWYMFLVLGTTRRGFLFSGSILQHCPGRWELLSMLQDIPKQCSKKCDHCCSLGGKWGRLSLLQFVKNKIIDATIKILFHARFLNNNTDRSIKILFHYKKLHVMYIDVPESMYLGCTSGNSIPLIVCAPAILRPLTIIHTAVK